jgi:superfamily II DNA or RNA helicase
MSPVHPINANTRADFTPVLRVRTEELLVEKHGPRGPEYQERQVPVLQLSFEYGSVRILADEDRDGFFVAEGNTVAKVLRETALERQAQFVLESFGAVELGCVEGFGEAQETEAQYLVSVSDNVHALCSFSAYAVPQLRQLGWRVDVDEDYPYQVIDSGSAWYAQVDEDARKDDWFSLELGIEHEGVRINLLPGLLELLQNSSDSESLASLLRAPARFRALRVDSHRYVVIPPARLERLLFVLEELYDGDNQIRFSSASAASVSELDTVFDSGHQRGLVWRGARDVIDRGGALRQPSEEQSQSVPGLQAELRPYQQDGLNWLQALRSNGAAGVLADDMGLGKTLQTIAHLAKEKIQGRMQKPTLVILPTSLIGNWQRELKRFAPFLRVCTVHGSDRKTSYERIPRSDVVLTTYPILVRDLMQFRTLEYYYLILDEAQAIKNSRSQARAAVVALCSEHRLCLSGTPVENNLGELWSLFDFLMPSLLGERHAFRTRYQIPIEKDGNERRLVQLRSRVAPYILRRMKNTVAKDLPPKTELVRAIDLLGEQRELYESIRIAAHADVRQVIRKKGLAASTITILDALMKLRQVCCDPRLITSNVARHVDLSVKYEFLMAFVREHLEQGRRILVFSQFTQMLALIGNGLKAAGIDYSVLTGATADRQAQCDEFERGDTDIFLISLKAGGTGLNLTSADTVVHYDPWWNPAAQAQATDRAYRIGQTRPVFVYNLIVAGSVEERMLQLQSRKRHLAETILGGGVGPGLTQQDIDDLFSPLSPDDD